MASELRSHQMQYFIGNEVGVSDIGFCTSSAANFSSRFVISEEYPEKRYRTEADRYVQVSFHERPKPGD